MKKKTEKVEKKIPASIVFYALLCRYKDQYILPAHVIDGIKNLYEYSPGEFNDFRNLTGRYSGGWVRMPDPDNDEEFQWENSTGGISSYPGGSRRFPIDWKTEFHGGNSEYQEKHNLNMSVLLKDKTTNEMFFLSMKEYDIPIDENSSELKASISRGFAISPAEIWERYFGNDIGRDYLSESSSPEFDNRNPVREIVYGAVKNDTFSLALSFINACDSKNKSTVLVEPQIVDNEDPDEGTIFLECSDRNDLIEKFPEMANSLSPQKHEQYGAYYVQLLRIAPELIDRIKIIRDHFPQLRTLQEQADFLQVAKQTVANTLPMKKRY